MPEQDPLKLAMLVAELTAKWIVNRFTYRE